MSENSNTKDFKEEFEELCQLSEKIREEFYNTLAQSDSIHKEEYLANFRADEEIFKRHAKNLQNNPWK